MSEEEPFDFRWVLAVVRRWLWLIVGCSLLGVIGAFAYTAWMPPVYNASATLLIQPASGSGMSDYQAVLTAERMARTYTEMLQDASVLEAAAERAQLGEPLAALARRVEVAPIPDTQLIRLSVQSGSATRAALLANAIAEAFIQRIETSQAERNTDSLSSLERQMVELSTQIETTEERVNALGVPETNEKQTELAHLENILAGYRNTYATLLQNYEQMRLTAAQSAQSVSIAEAARVPQSPIQHRALYLAVAGLVGTIVGLGSAFLLESLDDTIKTPGDVKRALGLETLGTIGRMSRAERGLVVTEQPHSAHAEAFRVLCTKIRFHDRDGFPKGILVTSPGGNEGKSLTSANLAVTLAQAGFNVVAVDADLRRPTLGQFFDLDPRSPGLSRALVTGSIDGLLRPTSVEGLTILTSGALPTSSAQLLESQQMQDLIDDLAHRADLILMDGPPTLPVADAALLARRMDAVLLVLRAGRTRREAARTAVESLSQVGAQVIGVVLNGVVPRKSAYYRTYHRYMADGQEPLGLQPEQAQDLAPDGSVPVDSAAGEALPDAQVAPALRQPVAETRPHESSMPDVQEAAALAEATADGLPSGVAPSPVAKLGGVDYDSFSQRELPDAQIQYLFLDALHNPLQKPRGDEEDIMCAWAICADGRNVLLHVSSCTAESYEMWLDFLQDMVVRGLPLPILATAHGTPAVMRAVAEVFPNSLHQRCLSHKIRRVSDEIPRSARAEVRAMVQAAYYAPNLRVAEQISADMLKLYADRYPSAMQSFQNDWETCIAYLRCPPAHHSRIRTTTLLQRSFARERRQLMDSLQVSDEKGSLELAFTLLWQASQRWQGIRITEAERQQLAQLRDELELMDGGPG
jgi:non-specific protein-tyrosine kinase